MATNDFLPFATGGGANVLSQSDYAALAAVGTGYQAGAAKSAQLNKTWRQSSIMAAVLGQFIANYSGQNAVDDGTTATLLANLQIAVRSMTKQRVVLADTGAANAYTAVNAPALAALPSSGFAQYISIANANTGAATYAPDGLAAKPIYGLNLTALQGGELVVNGIAALMYLVAATVNSGNGAWILLECTGGALQVAPGTQSQHAAQIGQAAAYGSRGLVGANNATTPNTKFDVSADSVTVWNPISGGVKSIANTGTLTCDVGLAGPAANGRDQAGAFSASSWIHLYFIWNGTALATVASASPPPTGPTLPSGYTHWAYIGAVRFNVSSQIVPMFFRGARAFYQTLQNALIAGGATSSTPVSVAVTVPPNAESFTISIAQLQANTAGSPGVINISHVLEVVSGAAFNQSGYLISGTSASGQTQATPAGILEIPNILQTYRYYLSVSSGTGAVVNHNILGYAMPNGGE